MSLPDKPGPSPWLVFGLSSLVTVGGLIWGASSRDADLRHETAARVALEKRIESLEAYRGDAREILAVLKEDVKRTREDIAEIKRMLRAPSARLAKDN